MQDVTPVRLWFYFLFYFRHLDSTFWVAHEYTDCKSFISFYTGTQLALAGLKLVM